MSRRSTPVRPLAIDNIGPLSIAVSTRSGVIAWSTSFVGARPSPASWHVAHSCLYSVGPSSAHAERAGARSTRQPRTTIDERQLARMATLLLTLIASNRHGGWRDRRVCLADRRR